VIVSNELADCEFVKQYVVGCDGIQEAMQRYTPAWAEQITGVPAPTIERIAREYAAAKHNALAHPGWRTSNFINSFPTERAISTLNALVGNWGTTMFPSSGEGGGALGSPPQPAYPRISAQRLDGVPWMYPFVPLKIGVFQQLRDSIVAGTPYEAHGWLISRQNPVQSLPDRQKTLDAFQKMDFIVTMDILVNDTDWFSDVVLPEASYLERYDPVVTLGNQVFIRQPVIEPQGDVKSALWVFKELGTRLGLADYFQYTDEVDYINQQLAPTGIALETLQLHGSAELPSSGDSNIYEWSTQSGKVELFSAALQEDNFDPVPVWLEPPQPKAGEFYLLTGKVGQHTQFGTQNNQLLHKYQDVPRLWMAPEAAKSLGLSDWDTVQVTSPVGSVQVALQVTDAIRSDCVYLTPGFGHLSMALRTAYGVGACDSALHVTYTDPISGGQALSQTFVSVKKA
jgi:thiosulfate reductase/polysulfide reductase chain A